MAQSKGLVYVVDDDESVRAGLADLVSSAGLKAITFGSGEEFLAASRPAVPSCLVLDMSLPGMSGFDLQQELTKGGVRVPVVFLSAHGDIPMTVRAIKAGAANFLTKPVNDEELLNAVRQCITSCENELHLASGIPSEYNFEGIVGKSDALRKVLEKVAIVAPTDSTVLLYGETGTGKELVARAVHNLSARRAREFIRLNCAAIPSGLVESELFGHEKGAFTGALMQKKGRFELADRGTLFLDEIGDIAIDLQPKILRALQEHEFERLGSSKTIHVDVRVIAATHRDLPAMIRENKFREDLFYRVNVFPIEVPPLRERHDDIPLLVAHFVSKVSQRMGKSIKLIPRQTMEALANASWPGNVRQLENFIERCVILTQGDELVTPPQELTRSPSNRTTVLPSFHDAERQAIITALKAASGRVAGVGGAAARLGLKRTTLQNKMRRLNISKTDYASEGSALR